MASLSELLNPTAMDVDHDYATLPSMVGGQAVQAESSRPTACKRPVAFNP
jgi:hypothetical protein